jgi:hypothetical protein
VSDPSRVLLFFPIHPNIVAVVESWVVDSFAASRFREDVLNCGFVMKE